MITSSLSSSCCRLFLLLCVLGGCSADAAPVLQIDLTGLLMDTGKIDVILTRMDGTVGATAFFKAGTNVFTQTMAGPTTMPTTAVAVELPVGTAGTLQVRVEGRSAVMPDMTVVTTDMAGPTQPPEPPAAEASGCTTATIVPGMLTKISLRLTMPALPCP